MPPVGTKRLSGVELGQDDPICEADMLRGRLAHAYRRLADHFETIGVVSLADIFQSLADQSWALLADTVKSRRELQGVEQDETGPLVGAELQSSYDVWALAVRQETELHSDLIALLSNAESLPYRLLLMGRVRESMRLCAAHRVNRRVAYRSEQVAETKAPFPDSRRVQDPSDIVIVALAIEKWIERLMEACGSSVGGVETARELTRSTVSWLEKLGDGVGTPRRLERALERLNGREVSHAIRNAAPSVQRLRLIAESGRAFDYYDRLFEDAMETDNFEFAQILSQRALERLTRLRNTSRVHV